MLDNPGTRTSSWRTVELNGAVASSHAGACLSSCPTATSDLPVTDSHTASVGAALLSTVCEPLAAAASGAAALPHRVLLVVAATLATSNRSDSSCTSNLESAAICSCLTLDTSCTGSNRAESSKHARQDVRQIRIVVRKLKLTQA